MRSLSRWLLALLFAFGPALGIGANAALAVDDAGPLTEKAAYLQQDLVDKHWLDGLYVSIV